jgi:hypothetical protein
MKTYDLSLRDWRHLLPPQPLPKLRAAPTQFASWEQSVRATKKAIERIKTSSPSLVIEFHPHSARGHPLIHGKKTPTENALAKCGRDGQKVSVRFETDRRKELGSDEFFLGVTEMLYLFPECREEVFDEVKATNQSVILGLLGDDYVFKTHKTGEENFDFFYFGFHAGGQECFRSTSIAKPVYPEARQEVPPLTFWLVGTLLSP